MKYTFTLGALAGLSTVLAAGNVQTFKGSLGGAAPPVNENDASNRPFSVDGATFLNKGAALQRSCAVQHNACASAANSGEADFDVADCDQQRMHILLCYLISSSRAMPLSQPHSSRMSHCSG